MAIKPVRIPITGFDKASEVIAGVHKNLDKLGKNVKTLDQGFGGFLGSAAVSAGILSLASKTGALQVREQMQAVETANARLGGHFHLAGEELDRVTEKARVVQRETGAAFSDLHQSTGILLADGVFQAQNIEQGFMLAAHASKAYGATVQESASATESVARLMNVSIGRLPEVFGGMAEGIAGSKVQMGDLLKQLPQLANLAANVGLTGEKGMAELVATLGVVSKGTNNAGEAITGTLGLLEATISRRATNSLRRADEVWGTGLLAAMDASAAAGGSRLQGLLGRMSEILPKLSSEQRSLFIRQVLPGAQEDAINALVNNFGEFQARSNAALGGGSRFADDYARSMQTLNGEWDRMTAKVRDQFMPAASAANELLEKTLRLLNQNEAIFQVVFWTALAAGMSSSLAVVLRMASAFKLLAGAARTAAGAQAAATVAAGGAGAAAAAGRGAVLGKLARFGARGLMFGGPAGLATLGLIEAFASLKTLEGPGADGEEAQRRMDETARLASQFKNIGSIRPEAVGITKSAKADITVAFENAPPGTKVAAESDAEVDLDVLFGRVGRGRQF